MKYYTLCLVILLKSSCSMTESVKQCPKYQETKPNGLCICDQAESSVHGWTLTCVNETTYENHFCIQYVMDTKISYQCLNRKEIEESLLQQLNVPRIRTLIFRSCDLPTASYFDMFPDMQVDELIVERKWGNGNFTAEVFKKNVSLDLKSLSLGQNKIRSLPAEIFDSFTGLKFLSLSDNRLRTLPGKFFWKLINLEVLDLGTNNLEKLPEDLFEGLFQLQRLYLYKNSLKRLPNGVFDSLVGLKILDLSDNHLIDLQGDIFSGLSQMIHITLRANWLEVLPPELFRSSRNLKYVDISLNKFMEPLPEDLLVGLTLLENISLNNCHLTDVYEDFFVHSPNITHLRLDYNAISLLPEGIFRNNTQLKELNLDYNRIHELPENLFPDQKRLDKLLLFGNNLSVIPTDLFAHANNIAILTLGQNHLVNLSRSLFENLPKLEKLELSKNNLRRFNLGFNKEIKYVDLSYNNLTEMPFMEWTYHLKMEIFNIEYNKLSSISIPILYSTKERNPEVYFGHNNITSINIQDVILNDKYIIQELSANNYEKYVETTVSLHPNPFNCDCNLYNFYDYLQKTNEVRKRSVRFTYARNFTCHLPDELRGQRVLLLSGERFQCAVEDNCSEHCKCKFRGKDKATIVDCSQKKLTTPPEMVPHNTSVLYFQNNAFSDIEKLNSPSWENLTTLVLDNNLLATLDKWNIPPNLKNVSLRGNHLKYLPQSLMNFTAHTKGFQIFLGENPWSCNCSTVHFKKWVTKHYEKIKDIENVMCSKEAKVNGTYVRFTVLSIPDYVMCPTSNRPYKLQLIFVTTACVILALLLLTMSILYYRNKQTVVAYAYIHLYNFFVCFFNEQDIDEDKIFDAFVSYSSTDRDIALRLLQELENKEPHFRLCIHERNWLPGNLISWNIINSVQNSRRTILVVSKDFLESMWFQVEFHTAYYQMLEDKIDRLIVIVKGDLPPKDKLDKDLQYLLSTKTYLVWEEKWFWEKLKYAMPHKKNAVISNDVMALKERPNSERVKKVENQIAILSSVDKSVCKTQGAIQNGNNTLTFLSQHASNNRSLNYPQIEKLSI